MVKLRNLRVEDAQLMLEWMHDESVTKDLKKDFEKKNINDCLKFIEESWSTTENIHFAIDVNGEYMGTVSLKNIEKDMAEFAIVIRQCAMGRGIAEWAMHEIIRIGFEDFKLKRIYWYVDVANKRAVKFYDKNGYTRVESLKKSETDEKYIWYQVMS